MAGGFGNPPGAIYGLPGSARDARFGLTNPNHRERRKTVRGDGMFKKLTAEGAEIHREFFLCGLKLISPGNAGKQSRRDGMFVASVRHRSHQSPVGAAYLQPQICRPHGA